MIGHVGVRDGLEAREAALTFLFVHQPGIVVVVQVPPVDVGIDDSLFGLASHADSPGVRSRSAAMTIAALSSN